MVTGWRLALIQRGEIMESRFDEMTKVLAGGIPRREALWRLGGLAGGAIMALLGWGPKAKADSTASDCAHFCNAAFPQDNGDDDDDNNDGPDRQACKRACKACGGLPHFCLDANGHFTCCTDPHK